MTTHARLKALLARVGLREPLAFVRRVIERPKTLAEELEFLKDYRTFRRNFGFLAGGTQPSGPAQKLLVISLTNWLAQVKTAGMLAKAAQLHGYAPVILTRRAYGRSLKYYRVFGFRDAIFFDDFLPAGIPAGVEEELGRVLDGSCTVQVVKAFQYRGVRVGRQALATLLRRSHQARVNVDDARTREGLRALMVEGIQAVEAAQALLNVVRPAIGLVNDPMYIGVGAVFEEALHRGIPVIQWVASQRDDALVFKRYDERTRDVHPFSLSEDTWTMVRQEGWTARQELELRRDLLERYVEGKWESYYNRPYGACLDREAVQRRVGLDPNKKTAVIFPHILWDPTMFWGDDLFEDYEDWLIQTVRAACENPAVNWVVRFHPANLWKLKVEGLGPVPLEKQVLAARFGNLPAHVRCLGPEEEVNTFALFDVADYCVTVRGTIGIEMAVFGIPVLTAGTGRYSGRGFTVDASTRAEYLSKLLRIQDIPRLTSRQTELAKQYAHALFMRRPTTFSTFRVVFRSLAEAGHPFCNNVRVTARSFQELVDAQDLRRFARWALHAQEADFLTPAGDEEDATVGESPSGHHHAMV